MTNEMAMLTNITNDDYEGAVDAILHWQVFLAGKDVDTTIPFTYDDEQYVLNIVKTPILLDEELSCMFVYKTPNGSRFEQRVDRDVRTVTHRMRLKILKVLQAAYQGN